MASVNVSEAEFTIVADAANDAQARGELMRAKALDKLARKINAALSTYNVRRKLHVPGAPPSPGITWRDVPSVLR